MLNRTALVICLALLITEAAHAAEIRLLSVSLDTKRIAVGQPAHAIVEVANDGDAPAGPVDVTVGPVSLTPRKESFTIPAHAVAERQVRFEPTRSGIFNVRVNVAIAARRVATLDAGVLEVTETPGILAEYGLAPIGPGLLALAGTLVTLYFTIRKQQQILVETRQQKAADAVAQIVLQVARDYYGTIGGATKGLADAARDFRARRGDVDHLFVRSFFFFGTVVHKDNEFAFGQGLLFLPDLWAERDMRSMIDEVVDLVPLTPPQEAVVHKFFSDVALIQKTHGEADVSFKARNLYDVEKLLSDQSGENRDDHRQVQEVFNAVKTRFRDADVLTWIVDIERAMRALMEYEFTVLFSDFYRKAGAREPRQLQFRMWRGRSVAWQRERPKDLPVFDQIVGEPTWQEVRDILDRLDRQREKRSAERVATQE